MNRLFIFLICLAPVLGFSKGQENTDYKTWNNRYGSYVYINGLEEDLFQEYLIKDSRGPKWGKDADFIADVVREDFHERHTYWSEGGYPEYACPEFTEEDFDNATEEEFGLSWEAVKRVKGSKKTIFYLASYTITINGNGKTCTYIQNDDQKYVFLNKLKDEKPIYLGLLSDELPTEE